MGINNSYSSNNGLLADDDILAAVNNNLLISEDFDNKQLDGCCYEFRVGDISYTYDYEKKQTSQRKQASHTINPFETLTIVTMEKVNLDQEHFLLLFSKGSLFSMGLTPVCTAADPGFRGRLGITMTNLSARPIHFEKGISFVKGCFFRLKAKASSPYVGQHGDATMSWPYPSQFHADPVDYHSLEAKCWKSLPRPLRNIISKVIRIEKYLKILGMLFVFLLIVNGVAPFVLEGDKFLIVEKTLDISGSLASIAGLIITFVLFKTGGE